MKDIAVELRHTVDQTGVVLSQMSEDEVSTKAGPDKWSKKEILGHLIDSAANNHQRFVRAAYNAAQLFPPYSQTEWVRIQRYDEATWSDLVVLWSVYNRHLSHIISGLPKEAFSSLCNIGKEKPVTLEFVVKDYLRHLRHHLGQLVGG